MITSLRLVNFKNFADETLHLGPFTLIVGANASGKSNIRDAFRFILGLSLNYTLAEILGGKYGAEWQPIRGAPNEIIRFGQDDFFLEVEMTPARLLMPSVKSLRYSVRIQREDTCGGRFRVAAESLAADPATADSIVSGTLYTSSLPPDTSAGPQERDLNLRLFFPTKNRPDESIDVASDRSGLSQLPTQLYDHLLESKERIDSADWTKEIPGKTKAGWGWLEVSLKLFGIRLFEMSPERMRQPSVSGATRLGDTGDNLATLLEAICSNPQRKNVLLSWLHELTPMDVSDLTFPRDPSGRIHLQIQEANGRSVSAYSASDGTLRFLGMLAALLNEEFEGLYFFEEIDNGIHPARLHLLLDLIERQTAKGKIQVIATTHSPDVLNLISDTTFENTSVVYRDEDSADAVIRRVAELPNARELRKSQGLGRLHAGGWMENILSFAEADREDQKDRE
ncbi:MAG: ATP-binding protein [Chloroflexi bacterium]|nr:ATP-binding protein [Chloroflexota bacterium]